jgi:hypothetical protein
MENADYVVQAQAGPSKHVPYHPELNELSSYDNDKLTEVIQEYNQWFSRHNQEKYKLMNQVQHLWAHAIYEIKSFINETMVERLSTLSDTIWYNGRFSMFPVIELLDDIEIIRKELLKQEVHNTLLGYEPVLLMNILNKLETCTRRVIQNTSIQRLHQKSRVQA